MHSIRTRTIVLPTTPGALLGYTRSGRPIRVQAGGSQPSGETPPAGTPPAPPANPPAGSTPPAQPPAGSTPPAGDPKTFDETYVKGLRDEAAKHRTEKQQTATERDTLKATLDALAKVLDPKSAETDPEKIAKDLATSQAEGKQAKLELAIYRAGTTAGADVAALLDSRGFLASVADIDPTDSKAITAAIEKAVKDNPKLKAGQAPPPRSGGDMPPAPGGKARPTSLGAAVGAAYGAQRS